MSLIEEALRKQREESEKSAPPSPPPPPIPSPSPDEAPPDAPPAEASPRRPWALLAGIAGAGVLAILFVIWLLVFGMKLWQTKPDIVNTKGVIATHAPSLPPTAPRTNDTSKSVTPPPSPVMVPSIPKPPPQEGLPATPVTPPPALEAPASPAPPIIPVVEKALPALKPSAPSPAPAKLELPVIWPKLVVSGIIGSSKNGRSAAIMNGQMLSPGETIEGVTIESIDKQKVKLRYSGEVKLLSVGASTE
ncbi:MAG: hypothetical protein WCS52_07420 [bacterium]